LCEPARENRTPPPPTEQPERHERQADDAQQDRPQSPRPTWSRSNDRRCGERLRRDVYVTRSRTPVRLSREALVRCRSSSMRWSRTHGPRPGPRPPGVSGPSRSNRVPRCRARVRRRRSAAWRRGRDGSMRRALGRDGRAVGLPGDACRYRNRRRHRRSRSLSLRGRLDRRHRIGSRPGRQQRQRIDVPVRVGRVPNAEVHVRLAALDISARADRADDLALVDLGAFGDADRAEMDERHRPAVLGAYGQAQALPRQATGERDDAGGGRADVGARRSSDVDPAVLPAGVRVAVEDEGAQHRPVDRPRPGRSARGQHQRGEQRDQERVARPENHGRAEYSGAPLLSNLITERRGRGDCAGAR
jgi:hypothetical protein